MKRMKIETKNEKKNKKMSKNIGGNALAHQGNKWDANIQMRILNFNGLNHKFFFFRGTEKKLI